MRWIMGLICPIIFIVLALTILIAKPKRNGVFGYRTSKSTSSDTLWNYANKVMSIATLIVNLAICIPIICLINYFVDDTLTIVLADLSTAALGLIAVIIITQIAVNRKCKKS